MNLEIFTYQVLYFYFFYVVLYFSSAAAATADSSSCTLKLRFEWVSHSFVLSFHFSLGLNSTDIFQFQLQHFPAWQLLDLSSFSFLEFIFLSSALGITSFSHDLTCKAQFDWQVSCMGKLLSFWATAFFTFFLVASVFCSVPIGLELF